MVGRDEEVLTMIIKITAHVTQTTIEGTKEESAEVVAMVTNFMITE